MSIAIQAFLQTMQNDGFVTIAAETGLGPAGSHLPERERSGLLADRPWNEGFVARRVWATGLVADKGPRHHEFREFPAPP